MIYNPSSARLPSSVLVYFHGRQGRPAPADDNNGINVRQPARYNIRAVALSYPGFPG